jgi:hypothetical protein
MKTSSLIKAYEKYYKGKSKGLEGTELDFTPVIARIEQKNRILLSKMTHKDYNQESFKQLIASIELNGLTNFNMTTFWGKILEGIERGPYNNWEMPIHSLLLHYEESSKGANSLDNYTQAFNCNSVGCIAGFAMALALNWKQPEWLTNDSRNYLNSFENIACNYLNIPIEVGKKIFYGDKASVWAFVKYHERLNYKSLQWAEINDNCDYDEFDWTEEVIELESIDYKTAVDVLRRIANGEIIFPASNRYTPQYNTDYKTAA